MFRSLLHSFTFRFYLIYAAVLSSLAFVLLCVIYAWLAYGYFKDVNSAILQELEVLSGRYHAEGVEGVRKLVESRGKDRRFDRIYYLVVDSGNHKLAGNLDNWPEFKRYGDGWLGFKEELLQLNGARTSHEFVARTEDSADGVHLLVARNYNDVIHDIELVTGILLQSMLVTFLVGVAGGMWVTVLFLRRVENINRSIRRIMAGDLSERLPEDLRDTDFDQLTVNLNDMLDRIQGLMEGLRQVSDNIAHDLRTPLTRLRNHLAELPGMPPDRLEQVVPSLLEEADGLLATFSALLRIAQVEAGQQRANFRPLDLKVLTADVAELYEPLAWEKQIELNLSLSAVPPILGDRDLMFQAVANLVDNAIKYTPSGGTIEVGLQAAGQSISVVVADSGIGIPPDERDKVFRRFYRVESSRGEQPGNGLGLSLVAAVVRLHQGNARLEDNHPGLRVTLMLPANRMESDG